MGNKLKVNTRFFTSIFITGYIFLAPAGGRAQSPFKGLDNLFSIPLNYTVHHVTTPPKIDGDINDDVWKQAAWTTDFQDIEGDLKPKPPLKTRVKMLWDDSCLYIAAQMEEPQVWAYQHHHDDIVYLENDFELFINPNNTTHQYFEFEVNPINTIFDLFLNKPYKIGGNALISWDSEGLRTAVKVQGTVNDPSDVDKGWTVELAIPFKSIKIGEYAGVPDEGTMWRINFSRVEWDTKVVNGKYVKLTDANGNDKREHNWVWSPQGVIDMHMPERWGYLQFTKSNDNNASFTLPYNEQQRRYLWLIYYREKLWFSQHKAYTDKLEDFNINNTVSVDNQANTLQIEATRHQFMGLITDKKDNITWSINQEGLIQQLN